MVTDGPLMVDTVHARVVSRACELIGKEKLADLLEVGRTDIKNWLTGAAIPPPRAFLKMVHMLRTADPTYRPA
jgi:hypothetical protein